MTFWQYLKDQLHLLIFWLIHLAVILIILWSLSNRWFGTTNFIYIAVLSCVFLLMYLSFDYYKKNKWYQALRNRIIAQEDSLEWPLAEAVSYEQKLVQQYTQQLLQLHKESEKNLILQQQDQKDFIDSWVHEIKLPLAALQMMVESDEANIPDARFLKLQEELQAMYHYVEQVLYYARLDSFSKDYLIQEYALKKIVKGVIQQNANQFIQKKIQFTLTGEDLTILTDEKWFAFILQQIIANALKYTPENGKITIQTSQNEKGIWLSIIDNGIGIPFEDQSRIFDRGFTGKNGRLDTQKHATGLGLYLAKKLSEKLGHHIFVESEVDKGTTIRLFMPFLTYYNEGNERLI